MQLQLQLLKPSHLIYLAELKNPLTYLNSLLTFSNLNPSPTSTLVDPSNFFTLLVSQPNFHSLKHFNLQFLTRNLISNPTQQLWAWHSSAQACFRFITIPYQITLHFDRVMATSVKISAELIWFKNLTYYENNQYLSIRAERQSKRGYCYVVSYQIWVMILINFLFAKI